MSSETDVRWEAPTKGYWRRDFRLPEWLPAPVSTSFETWLLPRLDTGFAAATAADLGMALVLPSHVVINGWCYARDPKATGMAKAFARQPRRMVQMLGAFATMQSKPERFEAAIAEPALEHYRRRLLPAHEQVQADAARSISSATPAELVALIDRLATSNGTLMLAMVQALGFAGKAEFALATFHTEHLRATTGAGHLDLLAGLASLTDSPPSSVVSLDWIEPTQGELGWPAAVPEAVVTERIDQRRRAAEDTCRLALANQPDRAARFDQLLAIAQRWIPIREELAATFTASWPTLRTAMLELGGHLAEAGVLASAPDVFHLTRAEIEGAVTDPATSGPDLSSVVAERTALRARRHALAPPMAIGSPTGPWRKLDQYLRVFRLDAEPGTVALVRGIPASAGEATGAVRVVHGPDEFDRFEDGEILVATATAPAWTPLFGRAAAVVTDSGSPFAHASVVAREFGIPAVVGTADATQVLETGQWVTVDGRTGAVRRA